MKKLLLVIFCLCVTACFADVEIKSVDDKKVDNKKGKIVVLTSKGGGDGHSSACKVLEEILPDFEIKYRYPIYEYFHNSFDGEAWYGSLFSSGWTRTTNFLVQYPAAMFFKFTHRAFKKRFLRILEQEKPDLLISVIPFLNSPAVCAAQTFKIPFLLITLDADLHNWLLNMRGCPDKNFAITTQVKTDRIQKQLKKKHIPDSCVLQVGRPLRKDFFLPKDVNAIRKEWNLPEDKKIVMLVRGGTGSMKMVDYVKTLVKLNEPLHLLVCIGRNTKIIRKLNKIKNTGPVTFSIIQFTPKISDLMAVSDLLITQPSPNICNEAMHLNLPILIDMTGPYLFWEEATIDWIKLQGAGQVFKRMKDLNKIVMQSLDKKSDFFKSKQPYTLPSFNSEIRKLVVDMLEKKEQSK